MFDILFRATGIFFTMAWIAFPLPLPPHQPTTYKIVRFPCSCPFSRRGWSGLSVCRSVVVALSFPGLERCFFVHRGSFLSHYCMFHERTSSSSSSSPSKSLSNILTWAVEVATQVKEPVSQVGSAGSLVQSGREKSSIKH